MPFLLSRTDSTSHRRRSSRVRWVTVSAVATMVALAGLSAVGVPAGATTSPPAPKPPVTVSAYWSVASDGGVFAFGGVHFYGSTGNIQLNKPMVGMAATSPTDSAGYREVATDGGIFAYGDAGFYGSTGNITLNKPIVGMAATADGKGYWLVASDGGLFAFGDAGFFGSMGDKHLNQPIVGMSATADNQGYWLVASDGGVFAFGDAGFHGSTGNLTLQKPVVAMASTHDQAGYWMVASDGGVFAFGDAGFYGSLGAVPQSRPIVSMAATADGKGYWFTNNNGAVTAFGDATYWGSAPQVLTRPVVGMTEGTGDGSFTGSSYPSGSYGYDISNYQCNNNPPAPHTIGIVQVTGASFASLNPCLVDQAKWAGGGLNLYAFVTYGEATTSGDPSCAAALAPNACNYGFNAGVDAYTKAAASGINTAVPWWLDIEGYTLAGVLPWSTNTAANSSLVQGYLDALHSRGLNSVGIYTSPLTWSTIVGHYSPSTPLWLAWYTGNPQANCATGVAYAAAHGSYLPTGALQITQYGADTYDNDYAC